MSDEQQPTQSQDYRSCLNIVGELHEGGTFCDEDMPLVNFAAHTIKLLLESPDALKEMGLCKVEPTVMTINKSRKEFDKSWPREFKSFWLPLLKNKQDKFSEINAGKELHDLVWVLENAQRVYCEVSRNRLSKPMYPADVIISEFEQYLTDEREEAFDECKDEFKADIDGLQSELSEAKQQLAAVRDQLKQVREMRDRLIYEASVCLDYRNGYLTYKEDGVPRRFIRSEKALLGSHVGKLYDLITEAEAQQAGEQNERLSDSTKAAEEEGK